MMGPNDFCINYKWGCLWGKVSTQKEVDKVAESLRGSDFPMGYLGAYADRNTGITYSVYNTVSVNYLVPRA